MRAIIYDTDEALLQGIQAGNETAFRQLHNKFYTSVLYFSRRYVDEAEAQDIAAEAFIEVWHRRTDFRQLKNLTNFLYVTTRNKCYDVLRRHHTHHQHAEELKALMENQREDFFAQQVRAELIKLLYHQVNQLPPKMRQVFLLSFEQGLKPAQIAEQLGISIKTVKNQKLSAIKVLKAAMSGHESELLALIAMVLENNFGQA
ncbi:MAG: RNA polymerase sigma-70 factor [Chitinophagaceae bacterium]|nr:RNA polymerase sigma-70 factor [Chitinophagaceae bacterium]